MSSILVFCTILCPRRLSNRLIRPNFDQIWRLVLVRHKLPVFRQRAKVRQCVHSCTHPIATCKCMPADPTGLLATVRGDHSKKLTHCSMILKKKHGCISSHGDTQRNEKPLLNSAQEQAERPEIHHRIPTPHSIPLAILEMLLPNHADVKNLKKGINQRVSVHNIFESLAFPYQKVSATFWTRKKAENGRLKCTEEQNESNSAATIG